MPPRKLSVKKYWKISDELGLAPYEYSSPDHVTMVEEALAIFGMLELRPIAYQLGHRFYNSSNRKWFYAKNEKTLRACMAFLGTHVLWVPSIDEITQQIHQDDIRISVWYGGKNPSRLYRTYIYDHMFESYDEVEIVRYTSTDPWIAFAVPISRAYRRRFEELGLEYSKRPVHTHIKELSDDPRFIIDQGDAVHDTEINLSARKT